MSTSGADRKLLALGIKAADFTAEELQKLVDKFLELVKNGMAQPERKTYEDFVHPGGVPLLNVSQEEKETQDFRDIARQNNVNASLKWNQESGAYYLCLQGKQENIEKTFAEYQKQMRERGHLQARTSLLAQLERARQQAAAHQAQEKNKAREREHSAGRE